MKYPNGTISNSKFGIQISFERNSQGINGILINYHLICAILVLVAAINFLIDPKVVPGRAGLMVTIFLVLTNIFTSAQVISSFARSNTNITDFKSFLFSFLNRIITHQEQDSTL